MMKGPQRRTSDVAFQYRQRRVTSKVRMHYQPTAREQRATLLCSIVKNERRWYAVSDEGLWPEWERDTRLSSDDRHYYAVSAEGRWQYEVSAREGRSHGVEITLKQYEQMLDHCRMQYEVSATEWATAVCRGGVTAMKSHDGSTSISYYRISLRRNYETMQDLLGIRGIKMMDAIETDASRTRRQYGLLRARYDICWRTMTKNVKKGRRGALPWQ